MTADLRHHQKEAVDWLVAHGSGLIADCPGSGKGRVALEAVRIWGCRKILIISTSSMKLVWKNEVSKWLGPDWSVAVIDGRVRPFDEAARITIINHGLVAGRRLELVDLRFDAIILDESHFVRNQNGMSQAIQELSRGVPRRIALSASPIVNGHRDLINQLFFTGGLAKFGGVMPFLQSYCYGGPVHIGGGRTAIDWRASPNGDDLRRRLEDGIWLRRPASVLLPELPAVQRVEVPVEISNRREYDRIERELGAWLIERKMLQPGASPAEVRREVARIVRDGGASALVQLGAYRHAAGRGKVKAAIAWIGDFLDSGESLVCFVHHADVHSSILGAFPGSVGIRGGDTGQSRQAATVAFQDGSAKLIVVSVEAGGQGLTLTKAATCILVEIPWTSASVEQAVGRISRIGQTAARLVAYVLMGENTVDRDMMGTVARKAGIDQVLTA